MMSVCLSVCLSVTLCTVALKFGYFGVGRLKVVPSCSYSRALPIHFFRHFCCRKYPLVTTRRRERMSALGGQKIWQETQRSDITLAWIKSRLRFETAPCWPPLFQATVSSYTPYVVCSTIGHQSNSWASCRLWPTGPNFGRGHGRCLFSVPLPSLFSCSSVMKNSKRSNSPNHCVVVGTMRFPLADNNRTRHNEAE